MKKMFLGSLNYHILIGFRINEGSKVKKFENSQTNTLKLDNLQNFGYQSDIQFVKFW